MQIDKGWEAGGILNWKFRFNLSHKYSKLANPTNSFQFIQTEVSH